MHDEAGGQINAGGSSSADYCSMCGKAWCSVRINKEIREAFKSRGTARV